MSRRLVSGAIANARPERIRYAATYPRQRRVLIRSAWRRLREAHFPHERRPARIVLQREKERVAARDGQPRIALRVCALEPFERAVDFAAPSANFGTLVRGLVAVVVAQLLERGVRRLLVPERVLRERDSHQAKIG